MNKSIVALGAVLLALTAIGIARLATVPAKEDALDKDAKERIHSTQVVRPPVVSPCGPELAAQDLAGTCRGKSGSTTGALEIVGETERSESRH